MKPIAARANGTVMAALVLLLCSAARAWPLDGARIVFGGTGVGDTTNIYVTSPEGAQLEQLTFQNGGPEGWSWSPSWSPDGRRIAFSSSLQWGTARIYVMDADGSNQRLISDGGDIGNHDAFPTWSPRGDAVAFSSRRWLAQHAIYVTDVQGGPDTRLGDLDTVALHPSWRPVGDAIAYTWVGVGAHGIHFMDGQGRHPVEWADGIASGESASWHPRDDRIAFVKSPPGLDSTDVYTINVDGSDERRITRHPAWDSDPQYSPDATQILFTSRRDGDDALFIIDLGRRSARRVTDERFGYIYGSSWFDPDHLRSVSPVGRHATTWGWMKRLGAPAR